MSKRESEQASPPGKRACRGVTKRGAACRSTALGVDGFCSAHRPGANMAELGRRGGKARGRKQVETKSDRLERLTLVAIEQLLTGEGNATAKSAVARLVLDRVASNSTLSVDLARRALYEEQQAAQKAAVPAARAKLERLIEARAQTRAEEMYAERMRVETEAVRAELDVDE